MYTYHWGRDTSVCEINTHPTCGQCPTPPPSPLMFMAMIYYDVLLICINYYCLYH